MNVQCVIGTRTASAGNYYGSTKIAVKCCIAVGAPRSEVATNYIVFLRSIIKTKLRGKRPRQLVAKAGQPVSAWELWGKESRLNSIYSTGFYCRGISASLESYRAFSHMTECITDGIQSISFHFPLDPPFTIISAQSSPPQSFGSPLAQLRKSLMCVPSTNTEKVRLSPMRRSPSQGLRRGTWLAVLATPRMKSFSSWELMTGSSAPRARQVSRASVHFPFSWSISR